jgi:hypothetical protein
VDIQALHFYLSLFLFHSINLVTKLIFSLILNKINNHRGNDLVFACCWVTGQPHSSPTDTGWIRSPKTLQAQHSRGRKTGDSNSRPPRPPSLRLSNSRLPVRDLLRRQRARIRGLRDLRVLGPRIRGPMPET